MILGFVDIPFFVDFVLYVGIDCFKNAIMRQLINTIPTIVHISDFACWYEGFVYEK